MTEIKSQDIHFSQFYHSPFNLNPGLTGQFDGAYRFVANQRTQWRSVTLPYSTFGISADANDLEIPDGFLNEKDGRNQQTNANVGLSFYNDKAGDSHLKTTCINLALGKDFQIGSDQTQRLSTGMMFGYTSMRIDYSGLNYDNQWNGLNFDPNINPNEVYARSSRGYLNIHAGLCYFKTWSKRKQFLLGAALMNIGNPRQSFYNDGYVKLDSRFNVHSSFKFNIKNQWLAQPMLLAMIQGTYREINFGSLLHYVLQEDAWLSHSIYAGVFGRAKDAGYITAGVQYDAWTIGLSYDINTSNLKPASNGKGGFEISAIYIIPKSPQLTKVKICPEYM